MAHAHVLLRRRNHRCLSAGDQVEAILQAICLLRPFLHPGRRGDTIVPSWFALLSVHNRFRSLPLTDRSVLSALLSIISPFATFSCPFLSLVFSQMDNRAYRPQVPLHATFGALRVHCRASLKSMGFCGSAILASQVSLFGSTPGFVRV
jgi:hypothetical protein